MAKSDNSALKLFDYSGKIRPLERVLQKIDTLMQRFIDKVWVDDTRVYARTRDGLVASYPFAMWDRLSKANQPQREDFYLSYSGIHWPQIDEDLSFEGMFSYTGLCERTPTEDAVCYVG